MQLQYHNIVALCISSLHAVLVRTMVCLAIKAQMQLKR